MSMNANSKKSIPLSAYDRSRLDTEHAFWAAEKVLDASNHIPTSNPEPTYISDPQLVADDNKRLVARAVGNNSILQRYDPLPFDKRN